MNSPLGLNPDSPFRRAASIENPNASIEAYKALDLRADSPIALRLLARLPDEAVQPILSLSAPQGASAESPAFLTNAMLAWYQANIAVHRNSALMHVRRLFEAERLPSGNNGFLNEVELDLIEQAKQTNFRTERQAFFQQKKIKDLRQEVDRLRSEYEEKRARYGRDAKEARVFFYRLVPLALVATEIPVNIYAFLRLDFLTPILATIASIALGILFAISCEVLGQVGRQWSERFSVNVEPRLKADSYRNLALGIVTLMLGFGAVLVTRSFIVADIIARQAAMGGDAPATIGIYGGAIITNVIVVAIGFALVFSMTDPVPGFAEERERLDKLEGKLRDAYRSQLEKPQQQRIEEARIKVEQLARREADQARTLTNYGTYRAAFDDVHKLDASVFAILEDYRARLVSEARQRGLQTRFKVDDLMIGDVNTMRELDGDAYLMQRLHLGFA